MLESLITIQAILFNANRVMIPRPISTSTRVTTVLTNRVITANNGYYGNTRPSVPTDDSVRFPQASSLLSDRQASRLQISTQRPNYFASPDWTPRLSSTLSSSPSILFAARGGGELNGDSKFHYSTTTTTTTDNHNSSSDQNIEFPFRKYGYRSTPFTWEELDQIINKEKNLAKLSRSIPQEQDYQRALRELKQEWKSTKDYILHSKFNLPKELDQTTQLYFVNDNDNNKNQQAKTALLTIVPNDFPYYCAPGIEHWVLWKYGGVGDTDDNSSSNISLEDVAWAKQEIFGKTSATTTGNEEDNNNVIWWENPPNLKSLPEISHVHMFVRRQ